MLSAEHCASTGVLKYISRSRYIGTRFPVNWQRQHGDWWDTSIVFWNKIKMMNYTLSAFSSIFADETWKNYVVHAFPLPNGKSWMITFRRLRKWYLVTDNTIFTFRPHGLWPIYVKLILVSNACPLLSCICWPKNSRAVICDKRASAVLQWKDYSITHVALLDMKIAFQALHMPVYLLKIMPVIKCHPLGIFINTVLDLMSDLTNVRLRETG